MGALFYLAASGFVAALIVHLLTILGVNYFAEITRHSCCIF